MNHRASSPHATSSMDQNALRSLRPRHLAAGLLLALAALGCNRKGVCVDEARNTCDPSTKQFDCKGTWHAYKPGDGDLGLANGGSTCSSLGYKESYGGGWRKPGVSR